MEPFVTNLGIYPRYNELKKFVIDFYNQHSDTMHNGGQYALQGKTSSDGQYCCVHENYGGTFTGTDERTHSTMLDIFKDTEIQKLFEYFQEYNLCRSRIFVLGKNKPDYTIHRDPCVRLHVPIETNDTCTFHWYENENRNEIHSELLKADGSVYVVDTTKWHKTQNTGKDRIHIVCGCV